MSANQWVDVDSETSSRYVYYGVSGWLALFLVLYGLGAIGNIVNSVLKVPDLLRYAEALPAVALVISWVEAVVNVILGFILLSLVFRGFRKELWLADRLISYLKVVLVVSLGLQALWLAAILLDPETNGLVKLAQGPDAVSNSIIGFIVIAVIAIAVTSLQIWYFRQSKRVNATYRSRLLRGHPTTSDLIK